MNIKKIMGLVLVNCILLSNLAYGKELNKKIEGVKVTPVSINVPQKGKISISNSKEIKLETGKVNKVKENQKFNVILEENASTGYSWSYKTNSDTIKLIDHKVLLSGNKKLVGAPSQEVWTFKANQKGTFKIQFLYMRPWEKNSAAAKIVEYTVEVTKN